MGTTIQNVLHRGALPIGAQEFGDALRAISPPRFPSASRNIARTVCLAVSGGVDSMALAYLCGRLIKTTPAFVVADNPVSQFRAVTIDHGLREGSSQEALAVRLACKALGIGTEVQRLSWMSYLEGPKDKPKDLPNFESIARRLRYRKLGRLCKNYHIDSMLLAHHQDDQYETVLMRLLLGHNYRGLRGMRKAADIPECNGVYGVSRSGFWDDQNASKPYYHSRITRRHWKSLRYDLTSQIDFAMHEAELRDFALSDLEFDDSFERLYQTRKLVPIESPIVESEDGGVMLYRPLLEFPKDRLIATCEANNVPWWEDVTNQDATVTMRNAVRTMAKNYNIPLALQKPAILALSRRCEQRATVVAAGARTLLSKTIIHDMDKKAGTVTVQFPVYDLSWYPRDVASKDPLRRQARIERQREIASLVIKQIVELVTPDEHVLLANLQNTVSRLFPALSESPSETPKPFNVAGVYFVPIQPDSRKGRDKETLTWYLSREPYPTNQPIPRVRTQYWAFVRFKGPPGREVLSPKWSKPGQWALWDGRFWIRITHRLPYRVILQPFLLEHAKPFRELLEPRDRDRLSAMLKRYAPGKVRYTLPALYLEENLNLDNPLPRPFYPVPPSDFSNSTKHSISQEDREMLIAPSNHPRLPDTSKMKLVALPTLDISIPKIEDWLEYEIRYKRADRDTLNTAGSAHRGSSNSSRWYSRARELERERGAGLGLFKARRGRRLRR
ncbi:adenine nucleotide alpha hydrolases-like protein [Xylariaceae sp. FL0255]|nr:adenine nucleotide alpha hydrolases-like protein [Xylariaceae sp. FL0255]